MKGRWLILILGAVLTASVISGCASAPDNGPPPEEKTAPVEPQKTPQPAQNPVADLVPVTVYFGAHDAEHLQAEVHMIKNDAPLVRRAMEILVAGPRNTDLWAVLPPAGKVKSVTVKDRTAYVDFSGEIQEQGFGGSSREILAVGAIVNTLTEFPDVERVQILVEGEKVTTLFGQMDVSGPMVRFPDIINSK